MSARSVLFTAAAVMGLLAAVPSAEAADAGAPAPLLPACVAVSGQARYIPYGYNHVVVIKNGCKKDATCVVSTDVNPQPVSAEVKAETTAEILTFTASPSQTFVPKVTCKLH